MRVTRIFEDLQGHDSYGSLSQKEFVKLLARHKALLVRSDNDQASWSCDDFANFVEGLGLTKYEYVGGAGKCLDGPYSYVLDDNLYLMNAQSFLFVYIMHSTTSSNSGRGECRSIYS